MSAPKRIPRPAAEAILAHVPEAVAEFAYAEDRIYIVTDRGTYWTPLDLDAQMIGACAAEGRAS